MRKATIIPVIWLLLIGVAGAQGSWKRGEEKVQLDMELFRSPEAFNLPTAETPSKGEFEFEISHRFSPPVSKGSDLLWGLDGPVNMRLGLGYAITKRLMVTAAISNADDNNDWRLKYKLWQWSNGAMPLKVGIQAGAAWNREVYLAGRATGDARNFQYYGQFIINTLIKGKVGIGVVPSYVQNSNVFSEETQHTTAIGGYIIYYPTAVVGLLMEWTPVVDGFDRGYDAAAFGLELNTGGHFFKIMLSNGMWLNPSQYLTGSEYKFNSREWRLGMNITRLLKFGK